MSCSLMRRGVILRVTSSEPLLDLDQLAEYNSYDPEEMEFESNTLSALSGVCVCVCVCVAREIVLRSLELQVCRRPRSSHLQPNRSITPAIPRG